MTIPTDGYNVEGVYVNGDWSPTVQASLSVDTGSESLLIDLSVKTAGLGLTSDRNDAFLLAVQAAVDALNLEYGSGSVYEPVTITYLASKNVEL